MEHKEESGTKKERHHRGRKANVTSLSHSGFQVLKPVEQGQLQ